MRALLLSALLSTLLTGCHAKFRSAAPGIDAVRVQVINTGGPVVDLGRIGSPSDDLLSNLAATAFNAAQGMKEVNLTDHIGRSVRPESIEQGIERGIAQELGAGPPFSVRMHGKTDTLLQIETLSYGIRQNIFGGQGRFRYQLRARVYLESGEQVYKKRVRCKVKLSGPDAPAIARGSLGSLSQLGSLAPPQVDTVFAEVAEHCGGVVAEKLRKHAG